MLRIYISIFGLAILSGCAGGGGGGSAGSSGSTRTLTYTSASDIQTTEYNARQSYCPFESVHLVAKFGRDDKTTSNQKMDVAENIQKAHFDLPWKMFF
jgi:hypothetical protein